MTADSHEKLKIIATGKATAILPARNSSDTPITIIGTQSIRESFDVDCLQQALNSRDAPGVTHLVLNPDAHSGYGAPIGCVLVSPTHIYPGPVGVDIKCSMSLLQLNLPADLLQGKPIRRALINAILERTPTGPGMGQRAAKKSRRIDVKLGRKAVIYGAMKELLEEMQIPSHWAKRCEDPRHFSPEGTAEALAERLEQHLKSGVFRNFSDKIGQLGSYGGGNHFGECEVVQVSDQPHAKQIAQTFGLIDGNIAFLSHCGSRGFGNILAQNQFRLLESHFQRCNIPFPSGDKKLIYCPLGTPEADAYLCDMALAANFATINHLLINALILEAFQEVIPGVQGDLVYFISHNIAREEIVDNQKCWVHRKGATRAFPADHPALKGTPFEHSGHPILLPGNPAQGSAVMVAAAGAKTSCYSVNHGAGRNLGRKAAIRTLDQQRVDDELAALDILSNCRKYPKDEAPAAYKDFNEILRSVELAGLATTVARLKARFVIKDSSPPDD